MTTVTLEPASTLAAKASQPFPDESSAYRAARSALLAEEIELRRHIERVAAQRRALPPGGIIAQDYRFTGEDGKPITLSAMFGEHDTLFTYFWMFGPERLRPCPMCTAFIDGLDPAARNLSQRIALAIIGRSPIERQLAFKAERGWQNLKFHATSDEFVRDYHGFGPDGSEWPILSIFTRSNGQIRRSWGAEMGGATADPCQDPRGAPDLDPLWTVLDMTPAGRGADWHPKLDY